MKKIAALLVLANAAIFLYWRYLNPPAPALPAEKTAAPARILLASERPAPTPECRSMGPLPNRQALAAVTHWMGDRYGELTEREATVAAPPAYRVQLETVSADQAARLAQRLRGLGLGDIAVLAPEPGETKVVVAMGLFGDRGNADRRVLDVRRHGVEPSILPIERHASQWWIDFTSLETPDLAELAHALTVGAAVALAPCEVAIPNDEGPTSPTPGTAPESKGNSTPKLGGSRSSGSAA
jgi:hypothetical protein